MVASYRMNGMEMSMTSFRAGGSDSSREGARQTVVAVCHNPEIAKFENQVVAVPGFSAQRAAWRSLSEIGRQSTPRGWGLNE